MIPARSPEFKVHRTEGLANGALSNRLWGGRVAKYVLGNGIWTLAWSYEPPDECKCGTPFIEHTTGYNNRPYKREINYRQTPVWHKGSKVRTWPVCQHCNRRFRDGDDRAKQEMLDLHRRA